MKLKPHSRRFRAAVAGILLAALLAGCVTENAPPKPRRTSIAPQQIPAFIRAYRHDPRPDRIDDLIVALDNNLTFMVDSSHRVTIEGFLYLVLRDNPKRVDKWWALVRELRFITRLAFVRILWMADVPQADTILDRIRKDNVDQLGRQVAVYRDQPRPDLKTTPIAEPYDIYLLWGAFYATGDLDYVRRIVDELPRESSRGDARQVVLWRTAVQTLCVEAGDPAVGGLLEAAAAAAPPPDRSAAADVLRAARAVQAIPDTLFGIPTADWFKRAER